MAGEAIQHRLTPRDARRIAIRAQLLDRPRPTDVREVVRRLTLLQLDPTAAVAPTADLVLWSRIGAAYDRADLEAALADRSLVEWDATIRPAEYVDLLRADMAAWGGPESRRDWQRARNEWVTANDACRRDILARLAADGPLPSRDLPDTCAVPWRSTGWTNDKNVTRLLDFMAARGEIAIAGRRRRERLWDLAERVYPPAPPAVPSSAQAERLRGERRLRALGIARAKTAEAPVEPWDVGEVGEEAVVTGVKGTWRVDPAALAALGEPFRGRTALLSPFDRLVHDRRRAQELFGFEYQLEMYKPATDRRWGYYALPVLHGDRLVGKLDATADRKSGVLRVAAFHADAPVTKALRTGLDREIADLAAWLDLEVDDARRG